MFETIARSAPASAFRSDDLPAFGRPASTTVTPSRSRRPRPAVSCSAATGSRAAARSASSVPESGSPTSSGKSMLASIRASASRTVSAAAPTARDKGPLRLPARRPLRPHRLRGDQICDGFGLRQVDLAVDERPLGELAGAGGPHPGGERGLQDPVRRHRAAVALDLDDVLAGERTRGAENRDQGVVEILAGAGVADDRPVQRVPGTGRDRAAAREQSVRDRQRVGPEIRTIATAAGPTAVATAAMVSAARGGGGLTGCTREARAGERDRRDASAPRCGCRRR
jgi:hypothetical protein